MFRAFTAVEIEDIETVYQSWLQAGSLGPMKVDKMEIDFERMKVKKKKGEVCFVFVLFLFFWRDGDRRSDSH